MKEQDKVRRFFSSYVNGFDRIYGSDKGALKDVVDRIFRKSIYARLEYTKRAISSDYITSSKPVVLDVGCGTGRGAIQAAKAGAAEVVGVDISSEMIERARVNAREAGVEGLCEFIVDDVASIDTANAFDVVIALGFFDYIEDENKYIELFKLLARDRIIASFPEWSFVRGVQRIVRYRYLYNCPVHFYSNSTIRAIGQKLFSEFTVVDLKGADLLLDAEA